MCPLPQALTWKSPDADPLPQLLPVTVGVDLIALPLLLLAPEEHLVDDEEEDEDEDDLFVMISEIVSNNIQ
jgi:hypothetical protein